MDPNDTSTPSLISSLEALIQASVASLLDRRLGTAADTLDVQIQAAVTTALDRRLGSEAGVLSDRLRSLVDQRLCDAVSILDHRANSSVTAALEQRFGPAGTGLTAQITFAPAPLSVLPSVPPPVSRTLGKAVGSKENNGTCPTEEKQKNTQPANNGGFTEKVQPTKEQNATDLGSSETISLRLGDDLSIPGALQEKSVETMSKETDTTHSNTYKSAVYPLFADSASKSKAGPSATSIAKYNATTEGPSSGAIKAPTKRKATQKSEAKKGEGSETSSSGEERSNNKSKKKGRKTKLDPPGYIEGSCCCQVSLSPPILFRAAPASIVGTWISHKSHFFLSFSLLNLSPTFDSPHNLHKPHTNLINISLASSSSSATSIMFLKTLMSKLPSPATTITSFKRFSLKVLEQGKNLTHHI